MAGETKIIYYFDDEDTPYSVKLPIAPNAVTLRDFKSRLALPKTNLKFFFKSSDDDFGIVKEEVVDDDAKLPIFKGRVVSYIVSADGSNLSDGSASQVTEVSGMAGGGAANGRAGVNNQAFNNHRNNHHVNHPMHSTHAECGYNHHRRGGYEEDFDDSTTTCTETESAISSRCSRYAKGRSGYAGRCGRDCECTDSSSMITSDMDSTSFVDSDDDDDDDDDIDADESASRVSTTTADTSVSRMHESRLRRRRMRRRMPAMSNASSVSSAMTDSTLSMNVITVNLNLDPGSFLGISLIGQAGRGIFVRNIMEGGAVAADGRIETGDMILQVNDINLENLKNDDAVQILRDTAHKLGAIKLVVLKTWDHNPQRFAIPRSEPVRPIDPGAWVAHTEAARAAGEYPIRPPSAATLTSNSSSIQSSVTDSERLLTMDKQILNLDTVDMLTITKSMAAYDSGLDIKERDWLKIKIPDAFLGSDVVDWLFSHVQGFSERRDAKKYASQMMKQGFIRHTLNKNSFSEQCYYVFGDMITVLADATNRMRLMDDEDCDSSDRDTLITVRDGRGAGSSSPGSPWHHQRHQVAPATYAEHQPGHGFLPWGSDAVHYGAIFGPNSGAGDGIRVQQQQQSNSRSGGSSSSDADRSQLSGPLPISSFKPQAAGAPTFAPNHLPNPMLHHYQNQLPHQNQYSEPNYATAVLPNDSKSCRSNGIRNGEEIGS